MVYLSYFLLAAICWRGCSCARIYRTSSSSEIFEDVEAALSMTVSDRSVVYLFSSSHTHNILTLLNKSPSIEISENDCFCFDLSVPGEVELNRLYDVAKERSEGPFARTALLVTGVESLQGEAEVGKLNFLHSMTDANSMYANLVVILNWNTAIHSVPEHSLIEKYIIDFFGKGGAKMNPGAMFGRISAVAMESSPDFDPLSANLKLLCGGGASSVNSMDGMSSCITLFRVVAVVAVVAVGALIYSLACPSDPGVASTGTNMTTAECLSTTTPITPSSESKKESSKASAVYISPPRRSERLKAQKND